MKISAMKKLILLLVVCFIALQGEAQFNYQFTDESIPVTGIQYGLVGGGHTAQLFNRDDVNSLGVQPQFMNFNYFAGAERIRWYTPHFGIGQQALLWNAGAKYAGPADTSMNAPSLVGTTTLQYAKVPVLFYWKSYSRWKPDRRLRVNTYFGPYIAMLANAREEWTISLNGSDDFFTYMLESGSFTAIDKDSNQFFDGNADDGELYKFIDYGFVMGAGVEIRLWKRTVVALTLRTDIGLAEVENKDFKVNTATGTRYRFFKDIFSKYQPYGISSDPNFDYNRPETNNFSIGAQLSIRKYLGAN